jgi:hypothetical protein
MGLTWDCEVGLAYQKLLNAERPKRRETTALVAATTRHCWRL